MKLYAAVFLVALCALLPAACPAPGEGNKLPDHYILFYLDGQRYLFNKGLTDIETGPFAGYWGATHTKISATPDTGRWDDYDNLGLSAYVSVGFEDWYSSASPATPGNTGQFVLERLEYYDGQTDTLYQRVDGTATVSANAGLGGDVTGTFPGKVKAGDYELELPNGVFKVKRVDTIF